MACKCVCERLVQVEAGGNGCPHHARYLSGSPVSIEPCVELITIEEALWYLRGAAAAMVVDDEPGVDLK